MYADMVTLAVSKKAFDKLQNEFMIKPSNTVKNGERIFLFLIFF